MGGTRRGERKFEKHEVVEWYFSGDSSSIKQACRLGVGDALVEFE